MDVSTPFWNWCEFQEKLPYKDYKLAFADKHKFCLER